VFRIRVMIRQDESHSLIDIDRDINDPEEVYSFTYSSGQVGIFDCADLFYEGVRPIADQYAQWK
jgi:hypothetical protein